MQSKLSKLIKYIKIWFDQINVGLMTISDFLQSLLTPILPLFYIWAPAPEELS